MAKELILSQEDMELFDQYRQMHASDGDGLSKEVMASVDHVLRIWKEQKSQYLFKLLGEEVIVTKNVQFDKGNDMLFADFTALLREQRDFIDEFLMRLQNALADSYKENYRNADSFQGVVYRFVTYTHIFMSGESEHNVSEVLWRNDQNKRVEVRITKGQKIMRILGKLCRLLDLDVEFEQFRIAHSVILNQKRVTGTLTLSIHPMDFATASDNAAGWSSCMSWEESGCYRQGTVEMMNSPMVLCAYLASDKTPFYIMPEDKSRSWNSKKWRAWVIVNEYGILVNKNYPYFNDGINKALIQWVKELAETNLGWTGYGDIETRRNYRPLSYRTNRMYNDTDYADLLTVVNREKVAAAGYNADRKPSEGGAMFINFSGPSECMWCGSIENDIHEERQLCCDECNNYQERVYCDRCGERIYDCEEVEGPDGFIYCPHCAGEMFRECEQCGELVDITETYNIGLPVDVRAATQMLSEHPELPDTTFYTNCNTQEPYTPAMRDYYTTVVCDACLEHVGIDFSDLIEVNTSGRWGFDTVVNNYITKIDGNPHIDQGYQWALDPTKVPMETARMLFAVPWHDQQIFAFAYDQFKKFVEESRKDQ